MSANYTPVQWNRNKIVYDGVVLVLIALFITAHSWFSARFADPRQPIDSSILHMRAFGTCAFLMLSALLCIGPLARLDARFLPLLYNRRHLGVLLCAVVAAHCLHVLGWYFAFSPKEPWVAVLDSNPSFDRLIGFPFIILGLVAFGIMLVMAATSHDFWLSFLTPPVWKALHMGVYVAYAASVMHVALGPLLSPSSPGLAVMVYSSVAVVTGLHLASAFRDRADGARAAAPAGDWIEIGPYSEIGEGRGRVVSLPGRERIAIFRYDGKLSAVENACKHQNGPLGEGRIIDGCITCPWHGFQYRPEDGCAPPPYREKLLTYRLRLEGEMVLLDPNPNPPGTYVEPVRLPASA
jgi:nitrite reductase/ring-hydroxylating ferredoxin subunit/DMSO/TMAO reductase YedYZ heme-binding membrane subunit